MITESEVDFSSIGPAASTSGSDGKCVKRQQLMKMEGGTEPEQPITSTSNAVEGLGVHIDTYCMLIAENSEAYIAESTVLTFVILH